MLQINKFFYLIILSMGCGFCLAAEDAPDVAEMAVIAAKFSNSVVRVEYTLRYDKADKPLQGEHNIREEKPLEVAGFIIAPKLVVAPDLVFHPRFVKELKVRWRGKLFAVEPDRYFLYHDAFILRLAKSLPEAVPLKFKPDTKNPYLYLTYARKQTEWLLGISPFAGKVQVREDGAAFLEPKMPGLLLDFAANPVSLIMQDLTFLNNKWGKTLPQNWPAISASSLQTNLLRLENLVQKNILRVTLHFRSPGKTSENPGRRGFRSMVKNESKTEKNVAGFLLSANRLLVLANLEPKTTARLKQILVHVDETRVLCAEFQSTLLDYGCLTAVLKEPLVPGLKLARKIKTGQRDELLFSARIVFQGRSRTTYVQRNRIDRYLEGWRRQVYPRLDWPAQGIFLFDKNFNLLALPVRRRKKVSLKKVWEYNNNYNVDKTKLTPVGFLLAALENNPPLLDPDNVPLSEKRENRLTWLGVELQPLNRELARVNKVAAYTSDGESGALVSYVYPGSPAEKAAIKVGDILLRLHIKGQPKPLDVMLEKSSYQEQFPWSNYDKIPVDFVKMLPLPWPGAVNSFSRSLTAIGLNKPYRVEYFSAGKIIKKKVINEERPPHYAGAERYKSEALGLSVRNITYEVRRYFQMKKQDSGVIISRLEPGSKAAVAGLKVYEIITQINDKPVFSVQDFNKLVAESQDLRFDLTRMTRRRVVKISL